MPEGRISYHAENVTVRVPLDEAARQAVRDAVARARELRDWADFVHIRHIAEAAVPGFRMITPYVNARAGDEGAEPWFLHFYEMDTDDAEAAFLAMTPRVAERLGGTETAAFRDWAWHPQPVIDYVNTFRRVD